MVQPTRLRQRISKSIDARLFRTEANMRMQLGEQLQLLRKRQRLGESTGIDDELLLDQLVQHGFCADTIQALELFPLASVAWGSGTVTNGEFERAVAAIFQSSLPDRAPAIRLFQSWLRSRPDPSLDRLWEDYVSALYNQSPPRLTRVDGRWLYEQAKQIALASGGLFGFGQICRGEQDVLDMIQRVFQLD